MEGYREANEDRNDHLDLPNFGPSTLILCSVKGDVCCPPNSQGILGRGGERKSGCRVSMQETFP